MYVLPRQGLTHIMHTRAVLASVFFSLAQLPSAYLVPWFRLDTSALRSLPKKCMNLVALTYFFDGRAAPRYW